MIIYRVFAPCGEVHEFLIEADSEAKAIAIWQAGDLEPDNVRGLDTGVEAWAEIEE